MGGFHLKFSDAVTSNKVRVNYLAISNVRERWRHEVVRVVMCCETRGRRGKLPGLWYYFCTETIGRKGVLLTSHRSGSWRPLTLQTTGWSDFRRSLRLEARRKGVRKRGEAVQAQLQQHSNEQTAELLLYRWRTIK